MLNSNNIVFKNNFYFSFFFLKDFNLLCYFLPKFYNNKNYLYLQKKNFNYFNNYEVFFKKDKKIILFKLNYNFFNIYKQLLSNNLTKKKFLSHRMLNIWNINSYNIRFINFFYDYCFNKKNFLILNDDYSIIHPVYKHLYGANNLYLYKNFFFLKTVNFTFKSWIYFFYKFCKKNNIGVLFIFDYFYYLNFYKNIISSDLSLISIIPYSTSFCFVDYPLFTFEVNILSKLLYLSHIMQIYSISYNNLNFYNKYKYIKLFYSFLILIC